MKTRERVDDFWELIKYNYDQLRFAEVKSSVVFSIYTLFFSAAYTIDVLDEENVYDIQFNTIGDYLGLIILLPAVYFTLHSIISCVRCFLPRFDKSDLKSPLFFGDIAMDNKDFSEYYQKLKSLRDRSLEYEKHLSHMAYVTGKIAFAKFNHVNTAIKSLMKSIALFVIYIISLYIIR
ncbi:MAG: hypothetical protein CMC79_03720 [Flavobacteriaceae bacterium]|nr:hypothetical protein [Flavobacteriaceae bacterium]|tara:strand:- start:1922 stop:2455 length:534 start_codon:yes stop_codon:yes gene_type:complete